VVIIDARRRKVPSLRKKLGIDIIDRGSKYGRKRGMKVKKKTQSTPKEETIVAQSSYGDSTTQVERKPIIEEKVRIDQTFEGLFKYYEYCTCGVRFIPRPML